MNIYADRGNIAVLRARCEWRGMGFELASSTVGEPVDPDAHDLFYIGGGQDRDQIAVAEDMAATKREALHAATGRGAAVLAVCGGYQLLGHSYQLGADELPGIGLVDLRTVRAEGPRLIGNCAIEADLGTGPRTIAGFENHGGRTHLGDPSQALGRVLAGHGNNGDGRPGGSAGGQRDRHLPARTAAAQERVAGRPAGRAGPGHRAGAAGRHASRTPRTPAPAAPPGSEPVLILLAPSEGKTAPASGPPLELAALTHADELTATRQRVLKALVRLSAGRSRKRALDALGLAKTQAGELERNAALLGAPTAPAAEVYTGVLYQHLALADLGKRARSRAADSVLVASALFGVVGLEDRNPRVPAVDGRPHPRAAQGPARAVAPCAGQGAARRARRAGAGSALGLLRGRVDTQAGHRGLHPGGDAAGKGDLAHGQGHARPGGPGRARGKARCRGNPRPWRRWRARARPSPEAGGAWTVEVVEAA